MLEVTASAELAVATCRPARAKLVVVRRVRRHRLRLGLADLIRCFRNPLPSLAITARACTLDQVAAFLGTYLEGGNACL